MKILIIGAGAIGSLFAAKLAEAGNDVTLLCNKSSLVETINRDGIQLEGIGGGRSVPVRAAFVNELIDFDPDLAMVCVKSYSTSCAAGDIAKQAGQGAAVLSLQNGLGNVETIRAGLGGRGILAGTTSHGATVLGPGRIRHAGEGDTIIGCAGDGMERHAERVAETFNAAGFKTSVTPDVEGLLWGKLLINVGINPLTALLDVNNGILLEIPEAGEIMTEAVLEAARIAQAAGVTVPFPDPVAKVRDVARLTAANISSMRQDIRKGGRTEIEAICGAVAREAARLGIPAPVNSLLLKLVHALEKKSSATS